MNSGSNGESLRVALEGKLGLREVWQVHKLLDNALSKAAVVEVDATRLTDVDLSIVQLLMAARKSAQQLGRTLRLRALPAGPLQAILVRAGISAAGSPGRTPDEAFWNGQTAPVVQVVA